MSEHHNIEMEPYRHNLALKLSLVDMGLDLVDIFDDLIPHDLDQEGLREYGGDGDELLF